MNNKELEIFELCERLAELLGDKEAIADLKRLYERHPEMFKDMQEVSKVIGEVVLEPDLIMKNTKAKNKNDYIVAKKLNEKDMGDIGIRNDEGTNVIFHANKKGERDFRRLERIKAKMEADGGDALSLHIPSQAWMGANGVSSTLSSATKNIVAQKEATKEYKPISNSGESNEEPREFGGFFPLSYYDLSAFNENEELLWATSDSFRDSSLRSRHDNRADFLAIPLKSL